MTDTDLDNIYKIGNVVSHYAGLRAIFDAGYAAAASLNLATSTVDQSLTAPPPVNDVQATDIQTP